MTSHQPLHFRDDRRFGKRAAVVSFSVFVAFAVTVAALTERSPFGGSSNEPSTVPPPTTENTVADEPSPTSDYVSTWLPHWDDGKGLASLRANGKTFEELHPFWYEAQGVSTIVTQGNATFRQSVLAAARSAGATVVPTITTSMKSEPFLALLSDASQRTQHVRTVCSLAIDNGFAGIDIDYETFALNVEPTRVAPLRAGFATFIQELAVCLHAADKRLEVTMLPQTDESHFAPYLPSITPGVFDYRTIGEVADIVRPMAYDHATPLTTAGSTDPIEWVRAVATYTKKHVPARKIVLGLALYGYDWTPKGATAVTARAARGLAPTTPLLDQTSQSRTFEYTKNGVTHHVWFDTTEDTMKRVAIAKELRLAGVSFWALGNEDSAMWSSLSAQG